MDNQENYSVPSRAELIKLARESCAKNLGTVNSNNRKQLDYNSKVVSESGFPITNTTFKLLIVRATCAVMLFLTVLLIDKLNIKSKVMNRDFIEECVTSNQGVEEVEDFIVSFMKGFVKNEE